MVEFFLFELYLLVRLIVANGMVVARGASHLNAGTGQPDVASGGYDQVNAAFFQAAISLHFHITLDKMIRIVRNQSNYDS
jgi:hypothetical protein